MIWAGLLLGILGSLHCIGMCGPIALALPVHTTQLNIRLLAAVLYNAGRVVTYGLLGVLSGAIGAVFKLAGWQQALSIVSGCLLLVLILFPYLFKRITAGKSLLSIPYVQHLKNKISARLKTHTFSSLFIIGLLNGLLPCGLVSIALIGAIASGNIIQSSLYMLLFGTGTFPVMVVLILSKNYISVSVKKKFHKAVPVFVCSLGLLLIMRGMSLGIPYVSPADDKSCCAKTSCH